MCNFFDEKFEQINKLKYLMTLARNNENLDNYKNRLKEVLDKIEVYNSEDNNKDLLILTKEELASFNGEGNKPSYIALDGMIYDVTNIELFKKNPHNELKLGSDLTEEFNECHKDNTNLLSKLPIVGMLAEPEEVEFIEEVEPYYEEKRLRIIGTEELKIYDGKDGRKAYVAIDGTVYDLTESSLLNGKIPNEFVLGTDITRTYNEYFKDDKEKLKSLPIVGVLYDFEESIRGKHTSNDLKEFSLGELEIYNGYNGKSSYIAVDGLVYDVSNVDLFRKGSYNELKFGKDMTKEFNEYYKGDKSLLLGIPVVGVVKYNNDELELLESGLTREFRVNDLSQFNGKDGNPPYIAVFGTVYDLTDVEEWESKGIKAGCDLTGEYKEVYGNDKSNLKNLNIVGVLTCSLNDV